MLRGQWAGGQDLGKCGRQEGPSGSVPLVSLFSDSPSDPNSSKIIHSHLRLRYAAQSEDQDSLVPGGATRPSLAHHNQLFQRSQQRFQLVGKRVEEWDRLDSFSPPGLDLDDCLSLLRWKSYSLHYSKTGLTLSPQALATAGILLLVLISGLEKMVLVWPSPYPALNPPLPSFSRKEVPPPRPLLQSPNLSPAS